MKQLIIIIAITALGFTNETKIEDTPQNVSWDTLLEVEWEMKDNTYQANFNKSIKALVGKKIEMEGFIFPLNDGNKMKEFLLSAYPLSGCEYCAPGSSESYIMIHSKDKVAFDYEPITVVGTFEVLNNNEYGLIYKMTDVRVQ